MLRLLPLLAVALTLAAPLHAAPDPAPLAARYAMEPDPADANKLVDSGPLGINGHLNGGASYVAGGHDGTGHALQFTGAGGDDANQGTARVDDPKLLNELDGPLTISLWLKPDAGGGDTPGTILTKTSQGWIGHPFALRIGKDGRFLFDPSDVAGYGGADQTLKPGEWTYVAVTYQPGGKRVFYVNGRPSGQGDAGTTLPTNGEPLVFGYEPGYNGPGGNRAKYKGLLDEVHFYAAVLTPEQIQADMGGTLPTRAATNADFAPPTYLTRMHLVRWDMPLGQRDYRGATRQDAQRKPGPDAVDWPALTITSPLGQKTVFGGGASEGVVLPEKHLPQSMDIAREPEDPVINPGGHWLRPSRLTLWGRRDVYSTDPTARGGSQYELWTFPVKIGGAGAGDVQSVSLAVDSHVIYTRNELLRSLTLLLPQNEPGHPYQLIVNGRGLVSFSAGLEPIHPGDPANVPISFQSVVPGTKITVASLTRPETFPNETEWNDDLTALKQAQAFEEAQKGADPNQAALLASYAGAKLPGDFPDAGPLGLNGKLLDGAQLISGGHGGGTALKLDGVKARAQAASETFNKLSREITFSAWIKPDTLPKGDRAAIVTKRPGWWMGGVPFVLDVGADGNLWIDSSRGGLMGGAGTIKPGEWQHVAFTYQQGGQETLYYNGKAIAHRDAPGLLSNNAEPLTFGWEQGGDFASGHYVGFSGLISDIHVYPVALTPAQLAQDLAGTLKTRAPAPVDNPIPRPFTYAAQTGSFTKHVGVDVPRSPITVYATSLHAGMSGGFKFVSEQGPGFKGSVDDYARFLSDMGYDATFEASNNGIIGDPSDPNGYEHWMAAMAAHGLKAGINNVSLGDPNQAFYSANLPDFHRPKYRDAQLLAQRFSRFPNFLGVTTGADNAGYTWYWDWNGPTSEHPWGMALNVMQSADDKPLRAPLPPGYAGGKPHEYPSTARDFLDYVGRYNQAFAHYGYLGEAVQEINPKLITTSGSFGSAPGVGARGGYNWGTAPGREMFSGLSTLQTYDWNEQSSSKPLQNVALMDRLLSYYPDKPGWALLDDFHLFFGRAPMQRAYALALTRGVQGVGTSFLANPDNVQSDHADAGFLDGERDLWAWVHKYGGAYAMTKPTPTIGILYVNEQALMRPVVGGEHPSDDQLLHGSHEGKTFEALFLCHQAGWPAKIVTPEELKRGLPPSVKALLLVGLPKIDDTWHWYDGLSGPLSAFVAGGGRLLTDDESVSPLPATQTGMSVRAYVVNRDLDWTPELLARNGDNAKKLNAAMSGVAPPLAETGSDTVWAIPTQAGDTQYLTVVNQATPPGGNASRVTQPQTGHLTWHTDRPIYDVRLGRKLTTEEAKIVDLTRDGFQYYALPPADVTKPTVTVTPGADGFYAATVAFTRPMRGIPVQLTVTKGGETATVYAASGAAAKLPLAVSDTPGVYTVTATELLSGLSGQTTITVAGRAAPTPSGDPAALARFAARRTVPLTLALTPAQAADPKTVALAAKLAAFYRSRGRTVTTDTIAPNHVVLSLQPLNAVQPFPRWQTVGTDLILLGQPEDNVLLLDQARGFLLPDTTNLPPGRASVCVTHSPFVGECDALNVLADGPGGLAAGVAEVTGR